MRCTMLAPFAGLTTENWVSPDAWDYIQSMCKTVHDLETRVQKAKDNVEKIEKFINTWSKEPLFTIKEGTVQLRFEYIT